MAGAWLPPAILTASGRPSLLSGEIERMLLSSVDLNPEEDPSLPRLKSGVLSLTTHRLIWIEESFASAFSIPLSSVECIYSLVKPVFHSPKVRIQVSVSVEGRIGGKGATSKTITIVIRGKKNDPDVFHARLIETWSSRSWEVEEEKSREDTVLVGADRVRGSGEGSSRPWVPPVVGVSGILRKEQEIWESTDKSLHDAFQDLNALMGKAKEMVIFADTMRQKLLSGNNQAGASNDEDLGSKQDMQDWLLSIGIASPVTKESAGALYHQQLSRQLADFVKIPLEKAGGMVALIEIYCLFNRARGTELISPEDLLLACNLWGKFEVPVMLRKFDSGVMVIQNKSHSDEEVFARLKNLLVKPDALQKGVSPTDAAITLGIAPALAKEHLLAAESKGLVCRDVSPEGFCFYINLFKNIDPKDMYRVDDHSLLYRWTSATAVSG